MPNWPEGLKRTRPRALVLGALRETEWPLTASDLHLKLQQEGNPLPLSSIYRVLDTFLECGVLRKAATLSGGTALYECTGEAHSHYAVCLCCGGVLPLSHCPIDMVLPGLEERGFCATGHHIQITGYCSRCRDSGKNETKRTR